MAQPPGAAILRRVAGRARVRAWFERLRALPGFVADLEPYGENARAGAGPSIYG
jgi:hypothetical protein